MDNFSELVKLALAALGGAAALAAALFALTKVWTNHLLAKALAEHKIQLERETSAQLERLKHELQMDASSHTASINSKNASEIEKLKHQLHLVAAGRSYTYQRLAEKRADALSELYSRVSDYFACAASLGDFLVSEDFRIQSAREHDKLYVDLVSCFNRSRIYLTLSLCNRFVEVIKRVSGVYAPYARNLIARPDHVDDKDFRETGIKAWASYEVLLAPFQAEIEEQFRVLLGVQEVAEDVWNGAPPPGED